MFENITKFFKKFGKNEKEDSKNTAKERLHLVLAQDRANISADFLEMMKQEIIDVIKKYIDIDEEAIDVKMTNKPAEDGIVGAPALYANIPIVTIKNEARKLEGKLEKNKQNEEDMEKIAEQEEKLEQNNVENVESKETEEIKTVENEEQEAKTIETVENEEQNKEKIESAEKGKEEQNNKEENKEKQQKNIKNKTEKKKEKKTTKQKGNKRK